jgi:predicted nucleotidyltransferase
MGLLDAIRTLNGLRQRRTMREYMVVGGMAGVIWDEPIETRDLDVAILVNSDQEYVDAWNALKEVGEGLWDEDRWAVMVKGVPVQLVPSDINPIYADAFTRAVTKRIGNVSVRVCTKEHLIIMKAKAFRPRDRGHLGVLLAGKVDRRRLRAAIRRLDADGEITRNLQRISAGDYP